MGRVARPAGLALLALPVLLLLGWVFYSRAAFGTWSPMAQPTRISYCDRTYLPGSHVTRSQIDPEGNFPYREVGATAGGKPIYAKPLSDAARYKYGNPPLPCGMVVYLKVTLTSRTA